MGIDQLFIKTMNVISQAFGIILSPPPKRNKKQKQKNTHTQNTPIMRVLLFFFLGRGGRLRQIPLCEIEAQIAD